MEALIRLPVNRDEAWRPGLVVRAAAGGGSGATLGVQLGGDTGDLQVRRSHHLLSTFVMVAAAAAAACCVADACASPAVGLLPLYSHMLPASNPVLTIFVLSNSGTHLHMHVSHAGQGEDVHSALPRAKPRIQTSSLQVAHLISLMTARVSKHLMHVFDAGKGAGRAAVATSRRRARGRQ